MRRLLLGAVLAALAPVGAYAQSAADLAKGQADTKNVLTYGMGYDLQRYSKLTQINKGNAKKLVPLSSITSNYSTNRLRAHSALNYLSPVDFELQNN